MLPDLSLNSCSIKKSPLWGLSSPMKQGSTGLGFSSSLPQQVLRRFLAHSSHPSSAPQWRPFRRLLGQHYLKVNQRETATRVFAGSLLPASLSCLHTRPCPVRKFKAAQSGSGSSSLPARLEPGRKVFWGDEGNSKPGGVEREADLLESGARLWQPDFQE